MLALQLDRTRASLLRAALRYTLLRRWYAVNETRLFGGFLFFCAFYAPIALRRSDLLLFWGPFLFGYPHVLASYRFLQPRPRLCGLTPFVYFALVTAVSMALHYLAVQRGWIPELPFGAWEVAAAALAAMVARGRPLFLCGAGAWLLWQSSWLDPLAFAAFALLFHNWVAFFSWVRAARGPGRRLALSCTAIFGLIHVVVFAGWADFLMMPNLAVLEASVRETSTVLSPWTPDPAVGYRAVVLYTFGLSLHYFVWLKALPECRLRVPLSWRRSFETLARDFGRTGLGIATLVVGAGLAVSCYRPSLGARIYFEIATLHGWLEVMFLLAGVRFQVLSMGRAESQRKNLEPYET